MYLLQEVETHKGPVLETPWKASNLNIRVSKVNIKFSKADNRELGHTLLTFRLIKTLYKTVNLGDNEHTELNKEKIENLKNLLGTLKSPSSVCSLA